MRHGRVYVEEMGTDGEKSVYRKFGEKFGLYARPEETSVSPPEDALKTVNRMPTEAHDSFEDLVQFAFPVGRLNKAFLTSPVVIILEDRRDGPSLEDVANITFDG